MLFILFVLNPQYKLYMYQRGRQINDKKLNDILHNENINLKNITFFSDIFTWIIGIFFLFNVYYGKISTNDTNLFIKYTIIIFLFKMVLSAVTILPDASGKCEKNIKNKFNFYFGGGCNDLIFSVHMAICLLYLHIMKKNNIIGNNLCILISVVQSILIILSHNHYTIDVLLAFIIVPYVINEKYFI